MTPARKPRHRENPDGHICVDRSTQGQTMKTLEELYRRLTFTPFVDAGKRLPVGSVIRWTEGDVTHYTLIGDESDRRGRCECCEKRRRPEGCAIAHLIGIVAIAEILEKNRA